MRMRNTQRTKLSQTLKTKRGQSIYPRSEVFGLTYNSQIVRCPLLQTSTLYLTVVLSVAKLPERSEYKANAMLYHNITPPPTLGSITMIAAKVQNILENNINKKKIFVV